MNIMHLFWIVPSSFIIGFLIGLFQSDTVQIGGSNNSISVNGKRIK